MAVAPDFLMEIVKTSMISSIVASVASFIVTPLSFVEVC